MMNNPEFSDITIEASDGTIFYAHLVILNLFTNFFTKALDPTHGFTEASNRHVKLRDHSKEAVSFFLEFCYTGSLGKFRHHEAGNFRDSRELYALGDYLMIPEIKDVSVSCQRNIMLRLVNHYGTKEQTKMDVQGWFNRRMGSMVQRVYAMTNAGPGHAAYRRAIVEGFRNCVMAGFDVTALEDVIKKEPEFAMDVFKCMAEHAKTCQA